MQMSYPTELDNWTQEVSTAFEGMSQSQVRVLALYSYGMVMTQRCGQRVVTLFLTLLLGVKAGNMRQRLREWTYEGQQKRGKKRQSVEVATHFAALLKWVMRRWPTPKQLVLALDVTYLRDRHTILTVSVLYRGCAIPVAWRVLKSNEKGAWHPLWVALLERLHPAVAESCEVLVLCDQGLYSKRLFQAICTLHWHPLMRIRSQGLYRRQGTKHWQPLDKIAFRGMKSKRLRAECFKADPLPCTLWVQWAAAYDQPCLIVTDFAPTKVEGNPYALRTWIEGGFKDLKRGGLRWEQTKMTLPQRLERLLFVMALAMFWLVRQGSVQADLLFSHTPTRPLSCTTLGWLASLVSAIRRCPLPSASFLPYAFPPLPS
jgi:hypothetical protein